MLAIRTVPPPLMAWRSIRSSSSEEMTAVVVVFCRAPLAQCFSPCAGGYPRCIATQERCERATIGLLDLLCGPFSDLVSAAPEPNILAQG